MENKSITVTSSPKNLGNNFAVTIDGEKIEVEGERGIGLIVVERGSRIPKINKIFDTTSQNSTETSFLLSLIGKIKNGSIVIMGSKDGGGKNISEELKHVISLLGSMEISRLSEHDGWAMITKKGSPLLFYEDRHSSDLVVLSRSDL